MNQDFATAGAVPLQRLENDRRIEITPQQRLERHRRDRLRTREDEGPGQAQS
jgi:hypothetical protein